MNKDNLRPVTSIKHDDKRAAIPDSKITGMRFYWSLEQQIDLMVYHLYGLTYDEVLIVDPKTPITREEYENQQ